MLERSICIIRQRVMGHDKHLALPCGDRVRAVPCRGENDITGLQELGTLLCRSHLTLTACH